MYSENPGIAVEISFAILSMIGASKKSRFTAAILDFPLPVRRQAVSAIARLGSLHGIHPSHPPQEQ